LARIRTINSNTQRTRSIFRKKITIHVVIYGADIRFWPPLQRQLVRPYTTFPQQKLVSIANPPHPAERAHEPRSNFCDSTHMNKIDLSCSKRFLTLFLTLLLTYHLWVPHVPPYLSHMYTCTTQNVPTSAALQIFSSSLPHSTLHPSETHGHSSNSAKCTFLSCPSPAIKSSGGSSSVPSNVLSLTNVPCPCNVPTSAAPALLTNHPGVAPQFLLPEQRVP